MKNKFSIKHTITLLLIISSLFYSDSAISNEAAPISTNDRIIEPTEIYGPEDAEIKFIIGNGGAGPTCLLQTLSEDYIRTESPQIRIAWIQTISRHTLKNLEEGIIDISLTYESEPEIQAVNEGWASNRALIFNDHFIIVGPKDNPAGLLTTDSPEEAFVKIAKRGSFLSRNDFSGTNQRERIIWNELDLCPWEKNDPWYVPINLFPADALKTADRHGLYTLTDRGTLLAVHKELNNMAVYIQNGDKLMNRCHAMLGTSQNQYAESFLKYLNSERAQSIIAKYCGKNNLECEGSCPLFTPANQNDFLETECLENLGLISR